MEILELEETLKTKQMSTEEYDKSLERLSDLYATIGLREKSVHFLKFLLSRKSNPPSYLLTKLASLFGAMGNNTQEEKIYREAAALPDSRGMPFFRLALSLWEQNRIDEALVMVEQAIKREGDASFRVLKGRLLLRKAENKLAYKILEEALCSFSPISTQTDWDLYWYQIAAQLLSRRDLVKAVEEEQKKRASEKDRPPRSTGFFPLFQGPKSPVRVF